jgi:transposase
MHKYQQYIGIDIAKKTLDVTVTQCVGEKLVHQHYQIANELEAIQQWVVATDLSQNRVFCAEHTGAYTYPLMCYAAEQQETLCLVSGLAIKRSLGIQRGKNDQVDAARIATYAYRFEDKLKRWQPTDDTLVQVRELYNLRKLFCKQLQSLRNFKEEVGAFRPALSQALVAHHSQSAMGSLESSIKELDKKIKRLLSEDAHYKKLLSILQSVPGIGLQTSALLLYFTNGFQTTYQVKELASYVGVVPFPYSSGSSIRGRSRTSPLARRDIKELLHMCAVGSLRGDNVFRRYYDRKVKEGKHPLSVINAIKNKLLHCIWACVRDMKCFDKNYQHQLA